MRKVLRFIATEDENITKYDIPYVSKYPDQFAYVSISSFAFTLFMSKLFVPFNAI